MRVLMVTPRVDMHDPILGFIPTWVNKLAEKLDKLYIITLKYGKGTSLQQNVEMYSLDSKSNKLSKFLYFNNTLLRLLLSREVDVMFCHMYPDLAALAAPYGKLLQVPVIVWRTHAGITLGIRISHFLAKRAVTASKESYSPIKSDKVMVIGHGIDTERFKPAIDSRIRKDKTTVLSVGRISPVKNCETLIKAADVLVNEKGMKNLEFIIVGGVRVASQREYYERLKKMVKEFKLENYVKFVGFVPYNQVVEYYQQCGIFITGSQTGSIDKNVLEAMACEKPVIACNEAFEGVLGDYSESLMFRKKDPTDLARKIIDIIQLDELSKNKLCRDMRRIVIKEHNVNNLVDKLIKVFESIIVEGENDGI